MVKQLGKRPTGNSAVGASSHAPLFVCLPSVGASARPLLPLPAPTLIQWPALTLLPACDHSAPETEPQRMQVLMEIENTQGICCCQDACDRRTINYTWETSYCMFNPEGEFPSTVPTTSSKSCGQLLPLSLFQHSIFILPCPSISPTLTIPISELLNDLLFPLLLKRSL